MQIVKQEQGKYRYLSNVVSKERMRPIQKSILTDLSNILRSSFGPHGSNTCIKKMNMMNMYTKDGYTILKNIVYNSIIEQSIKDDIEGVTQKVATTIGDGTTSAVLLSSYIFNGLDSFLESNPDVTPGEALRVLELCCHDINEEIKKSSSEPTLDLIYQIALISSNGSEFISNTILDIYKKFGLDVFIDVSPSLSMENAIKYYDGLTLDTGFSDTCYITDTRNNTATVDHPRIFFFDDPVDNKEMGVLFDAIISWCLLTPIRNGEMDKITPFVIVCPHLSRDMSSTLDIAMEYQRNQSENNKLPFLIVNDVHQVSVFQDICDMCGARHIRKYIDKEMYDKDVESGIAPSKFNIIEFAGTCDQVVCSSTRTKFINPSCMKDENGEYSKAYNSLISYIKAEIRQAEEEGDVTQKAVCNKRLHALSTNLVEINVGGVSNTDRDANHHLFEDAVLNCRSAAINGVGWGANFSAYMAVSNVYDAYCNSCHNNSTDFLYIRKKIIEIINDAYYDLVYDLYNTCIPDASVADYILESTSRGMPINLRTMEFDGNVRSSIESDQIVLNTVATIIGIMVTCNQFIVPSPQLNLYSDLKEVVIDGTGNEE